MSALAAERSVIRCQNCPRTFDNPRAGSHSLPAPDAARVAGWTVWSGTTLGGEQVKRVFCPRCAGRVPEPEEDDPTWDAVCHTCDARATEEWEDEVPLSEEDVCAWRDDHRCEPDVEKIRPETTSRGEAA
ncbi:hypothetical protein [Actinomadura decatromicini]|uniref:Uncharacterized protein n=1 Tax=Actinomadura decatromicini TaxID=2604572 RepID=A0A5D3FBD4_9ACTN|nr:hypothetical protein [Actinomadura decatromicini]TYK45194.1 hypothetical protein FXF68_31445 [Actinomadura decatromicini]